MSSAVRALGATPGGRRTASVIVAFVALGALALSGCGVVNSAKMVEHDVEGNKATIDAFNSKLQSGAATTFSATYVTTGSAPATVVYAVQPPEGLAFQTTPASGAGGVDIIVNSSGEYLCTPPSSGSGPTSCQKLDPASAQDQNNIFDFYTPAHWVNFLKGLSLVAGFAGDKVTTSTMTVNGFPLQCVDFQASGVAGTSTICSTDQGILGYVRVASSSTSFEIKSYTAGPPASLFELPPGAVVTTATTTP
jgi:uncharacterized protein YceK